MLDNMGRNALIEVGSMVPHPCNVLLVDDADNDRMLFKIAFDQVEPKQLRLLKPLKNGAEAISYLAGCVPFADRQAFPYPDLLILDLKMPLKNGFDVFGVAPESANAPNSNHLVRLKSKNGQGPRL